MQTVREVAFSLLGSQEIADASVMEVTTDALWSAKGPATGGLLDPRMGAISADVPCTTCDGVLRSPDVIPYIIASGGKQTGATAECPGHFGHIALPVPVFVPATMDTAFKVLASFCVFCGKCLVTTKKRVGVMDYLRLAITDVERLRIVYAAANNTDMCKAGCLRAQPKMVLRRGKERGHAASKSAGGWFPIVASFPHEDPKGAKATPPDTVGLTLPVTGLRAEQALQTADIAVLATDYGMFGGSIDKALAFRGALVLRNVPVAPPCARPSNIQVGQGRKGARITSHAMTQKLAHIVRGSKRLRETMTMVNAPQRLVSFTEMTYGMRHTYDGYAALQYYVDWLHNSKAAGSPPDSVPRNVYQSAESASFSLATNLKGKAGRIRGNLMGKRVDFSARTVITGEPNVPFGWIAMPRMFADVLTIPDRVTPFNRRALEQEAAVYVDNHASTRSIFSANGQARRELSRKPYNVLEHGHLAVGQIVERRLRDGDIVLLNRQPTLHGPSMQAVRIVIQDRSSIGLPLPMTSPFNADFDGDEMNLHVPQTFAARAEAEQLMRSAQQLLLPAKNAPCMGLVQDGLLSMRLMSQRDEFFGRDDAMDLLMHAAAVGTRGADTLVDLRLPAPAIMCPKELWTGKQLISTVLPDTLSTVRGTISGSAATANDDVVIVHRGQLLAGRLSKKTVGTASGSFQHIIATSPAYGGNDDLRYKTISSIFDGLGCLGRQYMMMRGFSIGIGDVGLLCSRVGSQQRACSASRGMAVADMCEDCQQHMAITIGTQNLVNDVAGYLQTAIGKLASSSSSSVANPTSLPVHPDVALDSHITTMERHIIHRQDSVRDAFAEQTIAMMEGRMWRRPNATIHMLRAGSKGNPTTLAQMAVMVGGQMIKGARVVDADIDSGPAPPPMDTRLDGTPSRNILNRLLAQPRFRSLPHFMRTYPGACEGGFAAQSFVMGLDPVAFWFHDGASRQGLIDTALNTAKSGYLQRRMMKGTVDLMVAYDGTVRNTNGRVIQFKYGADSSQVQRKPFPPATSWTMRDVVARLTWAGKWFEDVVAAHPVLEREAQCVVDAVTRMKIVLQDDTLYTVGNLKQLLTDLAPAGAHFRMPNWAKVDPNSKNMTAWDAADMTEQFFGSLATRNIVPDEVHGLEARIWLSSKQLIGQWQLASDVYREVLCRLERVFVMSSVQPGSAVGAIAAMSMGEPTTQMTLDSFHSAGTTAAKIGGVDRCNELVVASKEQKTPIVRTFLCSQQQAEADQTLTAELDCLTPFVTRALPREEPFEWRTLMRLCAPDTPPLEFCADGTDLTCPLPAAFAQLDDDTVWCGVSLHVFERFGLFYLHTVDVQRAAGRIVVSRLSGSPLAQPLPRPQDDHGGDGEEEPAQQYLLPASAADLLAVEPEPSKGISVRMGAFVHNAHNERHLCARLVEHARQSCPVVTERTATWLAKWNHCRVLVPLQQALRTTLLGSLVRNVTIDYHPLEVVHDTRGSAYLCPRGAPDDEQQRYEFDDEARLPHLAVQPGNKRRVADSLADELLPSCKGKDRCAWRIAMGARCISGFVATLWLDSHWLHASQLSHVRLEEELADGPLASSYIVHMGEHDAQTGLTPLRIRTRLCRAYEVSLPVAAAEDELARVRQQLQDIDQVTDLKKMTTSLRGVRVSGPPNTRHVSLQEVPVRDATHMKKEMALDVSTRDLQYVLGMPGVDQARTTTNVIHEAVRVMGVEAAHAVVVREFEEMVASGSCYVDRHHIVLMADAMLSTGSYRGFTHGGMTMLRDDPIMHASYEEQAPTLLKAGINGARVPVVSPAAAICFGNFVPRMGTAAVDVQLDSNALKAAMPVPDDMEIIDEVSEQQLREKRKRSSKTVLFAPQSPMSDEFVLPPASPPTSPPAHPGSFSPIRDGSGGGDDRFVSFMEVSAVAAASAERDVVAAAARSGSDAPSFSDMYSPSSPAYSPSSSPVYTSTSPVYTSTSPTYTSTSPVYSPSSPSYDATMFGQVASSPLYSPTLAGQMASSPLYSPSSPAYSPSSPAYSPSSPSYDPNPTMTPTLPPFSPSSPSYGASGCVSEPSDIFAAAIDNLVIDDKDSVPAPSDNWWQEHDEEVDYALSGYDSGEEREAWWPGNDE